MLAGKRAVSTSSDTTLKVWDLDTGRDVRTLEGHSEEVFSGVAVTPDGKRAVSASADKTLRLWDLDTGSVLRILEGHSHEIWRVAVTADGKRAVSASADNTLKVWDLDTGLAIATFHCDASAYSCAYVDEGHIVGGDGGGRVYFLALEE
jgi:WD40 repeat protein